MTDIRLTQAAVEQWAAPIPPPMQATQLGLEQWSAVSSVNTQMLATQLGLEMWASAAQPAGAAQARVMVMA